MGKMPSKDSLSNQKEKQQTSCLWEEGVQWEQGNIVLNFFLEQWKLMCTSMLGERGSREVQWVYKKKQTTEKKKNICCLSMLHFYVLRQKLYVCNTIRISCQQMAVPLQKKSSIPPTESGRQFWTEIPTFARSTETDKHWHAKKTTTHT